ncbi:MAG: UDP-N-acetylmuramoyl-tripeptide--D-alanyl-D-alanine ligase [Prevotellaceae bacterium]|jgi:UDP-N-acetylmuramoyl-tripeptide--D-alanyl-D-alanine ligase|nr:UDP-N-acetylmuramoyl-tripeptide--D-alanyl-D-alanine ligase [Prevotellaceae bacterium]
MQSIAQLHGMFLASTGVCTDSRKVFRGCIFFALKGSSFNGNAYAAAALEQGAAYAVVDEEIDEEIDEDVAESALYVKVESALETLQQLAAYHRRYLNQPIVAVTGTNGKTTTKELLVAVLSRKLRVAATQGNLNNHIGVPLTLLSMGKDTQLGVVEMGANHLGEIADLCSIAQPNAGLITNVGKAHLEGFGSLDGVKKAKGELYACLAQRQGQVFYLSDSADLKDMLQAHGVKRPIAYGLRENGVCVDAGSSSNPFLCLRMANGDTWQTKLVGSYNAANVLAAAAVGRYFGVAEEDIREAVESYEPQNHRSQLLQTARNTVIVDAYNANPTSMAAAVCNFAQLSADSKLLILGDMLELGENTQSEHANILSLLRQQKLTNAYLVGDSFRSVVEKPFLNFADSTALCEFLKNSRVERQLILLKGSRGVQLEKALEYL